MKSDPPEEGDRITTPNALLSARANGLACPTATAAGCLCAALARHLVRPTQLRGALGNWFGQHCPHGPVPAQLIQWRAHAIRTPHRPCVIFKRPDFQPAGCPDWLPVFLWPGSNPVPLILLAAAVVVAALMTAAVIGSRSLDGWLVGGIAVLLADLAWWLSRRKRRFAQAVMRNREWSSLSFRDFHRQMEAALSQLNARGPRTIWMLQMPEDQSQLLVWYMAAMLSNSTYLALDPNAFPICEYIKHVESFQPDLIVATCPIKCIVRALRICCCCFKHITSFITLVTSRIARRKIDAARFRQPDDTAIVANTSGTGGTSKAVQLTRGNMAAQFESFKDLVLTSEARVSLHAHPIPAGVCDMCLGATLVFPPFMPPGEIDRHFLLEHYIKPANAYRVECMSAPVRTWEDIADFACEQSADPADPRVVLPSVESALTGGTPLFIGLLNRLCCPETGCAHTLQEGVCLTSVYALTEALPVASTQSCRHLCSRRYRARAELGCGVPFGSALGDAQLHLVPLVLDLCETQFPLPLAKLAVSGPMVAKSYGTDTAAQLDLPHVVVQNAWSDAAPVSAFCTGDLCWEDPCGELWYCGRQADVLGFPSGRDAITCVPPVCVESAVYCSPLVRQCCLASVSCNEAETPVLVVRVADSQAAESWTSGETQLELISLLNKCIWAAALRRIGLLKYEDDSPFPTDYRHNSKIQRHLIQDWAAENSVDMDLFSLEANTESSLDRAFGFDEDLPKGEATFEAPVLTAIGVEI